VSELKELTPKEIHALETQRPLQQITYPSPVVIHKIAKEIAISMFKG
jgi:hypothetical protein